ncbi:MAG TPA: hypothetical protein VKB76_07625 [Ktedonobacterales bacterium]|nr:hypothetical protein [Ktedonobacterales bacterium]
MIDAASVIAQVKSGTSPPDWRIYEAKLNPVFVMILGVFFVTVICFYFGLFLLSVVITLFFAHVFPDIDISWVLLATLLLAIAYTTYQVIRKRTHRGFFILTDQEAVEYIPYYRFRPIRTLDFGTIQGMAIQTREGVPDRGQNVTSQCLVIRDARGKERTWDLDYLTAYGLPQEINGDIIRQFEHDHINKTDGLATYRRYLIFD